MPPTERFQEEVQTFPVRKRDQQDLEHFNETLKCSRTSVRTMSSTDSQPRRSIGAARNPDSHEAILAAAEDDLLRGGLCRLFDRSRGATRPRRQAHHLPLVALKAHLLLDVYTRLKSSRMPDPDTGTLEGDDPSPS